MLGREPDVDEGLAEAHPELLSVDREGALIAHDQSSFSKSRDAEGYGFGRARAQWRLSA